METIGKECWKLQGIPYIVSKFHKRWSTKDEKWDPYYYPPSKNSTFFVIAGLCTGSSADKTQPPRRKLCTYLRRLHTSNSTLSGNISSVKIDRDNRETAFETTKFGH